MDEVRLLNVALTPAEIFADFGSGYWSAGDLTSELITPEVGEIWDRFEVAHAIPAGTSTIYSILDQNHNTLLSSVSTGADISALEGLPIYLHGDLTTTDAAITPRLNE